MTQPLMPKATAVWLIEKTSLTFEQVADFVGMHPLEVQAIADGEVAQGIIGYDPVLNGQLTREEIARCEANPAARLQISPKTVEGHVSAVLRKLQLSNRHELSRWAVQRRLVD